LTSEAEGLELNLHLVISTGISNLERHGRCRREPSSISDGIRELVRET
jgi:hypothetical protein